jgi:hypothetical protein
LVQLLPVVDPGLSLAALRPSLASRSDEWFFYLDFTWIDQQFIQIAGTSRYGVQISNLDVESRRSMLHRSVREGVHGNVIWISKEASLRLRQESPALADLIEEIQLVGSLGSKNSFHYLEFSKIYPILEKLHNLDDLRNRIQSFALSKEGVRILDQLKMRATTYDTPPQMISLIQTMSSYPWRGYQEKDEVLKIALLLWSRCEELASKQGNLEEWTKVKQKISSAVVKIGYPTQILHFAQIQKNMLRDVDVLLTEATDRKSHRFNDAWLFLGSIDSGRYTGSDVAKILTMLVKVSADRKLRRLPIIRARVIETAASAGLISGTDRGQKLSEIFSAIGNWFVADEVPADSLSIYLDRVCFLQQEIGVTFRLDEQLVTALDAYITKLLARPAKGYKKNVDALGIRWDRFKRAVQRDGSLLANSGAA